MKDEINPFIFLIKKIKEVDNTITVCCSCKRAIKYYNKWVAISSLELEVVEKIMLEKINDSYCTECYKVEIGKIHNIGKQLEKKEGVLK